MAIFRRARGAGRAPQNFLEAAPNRPHPAAMTTPPAGRARIGVLTISDRASAGVYEDLGGPAIRATLAAYLTSPWQEVYRCIPDDLAGITANLIALCDAEACDLVVTTGGTGPA